MGGPPKEVLQHPWNQVCADCGARGPRWACVNFGIFICETCSGIHRRLGTHISQVRSVTLDDWKPEWVETAKMVGNRKANAFYEFNVPKHERYKGRVVEFRSGDRLDRQAAEPLLAWIRAKYEERRYIPSGQTEPHTRTSSRAIRDDKCKDSAVTNHGSVPFAVGSSTGQPCGDGCEGLAIAEWPSCLFSVAAAKRFTSQPAKPMEDVAGWAKFSVSQVPTPMNSSTSAKKSGRSEVWPGCPRGVWPCGIGGNSSVPAPPCLNALAVAWPDWGRCNSRGQSTWPVPPLADEFGKWPQQQTCASLPDYSSNIACKSNHNNESRHEDVFFRASGVASTGCLPPACSGHRLREAQFLRCFPRARGYHRLESTGYTGFAA